MASMMVAAVAPCPSGGRHDLASEGFIRFRFGSSFTPVPLLGQRRRRLFSNGSIGFSGRPELVKALAVDTGPDLFLLELAEKLEDSVSKEEQAGSNRLQNEALKALREASAEVAVKCKWPTSKDEAYKFTDVRFLKKLDIRPTTTTLGLSSHSPQKVEFGELEDGSIRIVFVNGVYSSELSSVEGVPQEVYIGSIAGAPEEKLSKYVLPRLSQASPLIDNDVFVSLNGIGALDLGIVVVPKGVKLDKTIHIVYYSSQRDELQEEADSVISMSNPRLLLVAEEGAQVQLLEEFAGSKESAHWTNSVCEIEVGAEATVSHTCIQTQGRSSVNVKKTYVSQEKSSKYKLVEIDLGAKLSRHNLHVEQLGSDTVTEISTFLLCGHNQLQDLHSKLVLNHPRGFARQLQKCIVMSSSGHGVFDGNIRVNRYAQQTDAGQLSRCLLLAPRATVNIKPNLQIVADDVKCSHGAAISDLEDEQLFYFQARGIDAQTARSALVFSFGAEVIERLESKKVQKRIEDIVKGSLASEGAILAGLPVGL